MPDNQDRCRELNMSGKKGCLVNMKYIIPEIESVTLYDFSVSSHTTPQSLKRLDDISTFITACENVKESHAFKYFFRPKQEESDFNNEIQSFKELVRLFANTESLKLHTALEGISFMTSGKQLFSNVLGFFITTKTNMNEYYIVNKKGHQTLQDIIQTMCKQRTSLEEWETLYHDVKNNLQETIKELQKQGFAHGDIKPDNVLYFENANAQGGRYKLIDWEYSRKLDVNAFKQSSLLATNRKLGSHPMYYDVIKTLFMDFLSLNTSLRLVGKSFTENYTDQLMLPSTSKEKTDFLEFFRASWKSYKTFKSKNKLTSETMFQMFKNTADLHSLGMMLYPLAYRAKNEDLKKECASMVLFDTAEVKKVSEKQTRYVSSTILQNQSGSSHPRSHRSGNAPTRPRRARQGKKPK